MWLLRGVRWDALAGAAGLAPPWVWVAAAAGLAASYVLRALRIHAELSRQHAVTRAGCLRVMLLHNAAVNLFPMRAGEAVYPALAHRALGVPLGRAVASLVWIRAQDALFLLLAALLLAPGLAAWQRLLAGTAALGAVLAAVAWAQRLAARGPDELPRRRLLRTALTALAALADAPRHGLAGWGYGAASWAAKLAALALLLGHLGGLPAPAAAGGALGGELAGVLPVQGPAGLGTYEAGVWAGVALRGGAGLAVGAPAALVHLFSLALAVAAGGLAWLGARAGRRGGAALVSGEASHA